MENAVMVGVLLAVVGVGLFGLYYAGSSDSAGTLYVPITGMQIAGPAAVIQGAANITFQDLVAIELDVGDGDSLYPWLNVTLDPAYADDTATITTNCSYTNVSSCVVEQGPADDDYCDLGHLARPLSIIRDVSNVWINVSGKRNASLPAGFNSDGFMTNFYSGDTHGPIFGQSFRAYDGNCLARNTSFEDWDNDTAWTTSYQVLVANYSANPDGSGGSLSGGIRFNVMTGWKFTPAQVAAGTYTIRYDYLAAKYVAP